MDFFFPKLFRPFSIPINCFSDRRKTLNLRLKVKNFQKNWNLNVDHSYITSSHFWDFWTPLPPYVSMFLVLRISKNWYFLTPLPLRSANVMYEWSPAVNYILSQSIHALHSCSEKQGLLCRLICRLLQFTQKLFKITLASLHTHFFLLSCLLLHAMLRTR